MKSDTTGFSDIFSAPDVKEWTFSGYLKLVTIKPGLPKQMAENVFEVMLKKHFTKRNMRNEHYPSS
jgi:hypothetical protein